MRWAALLITLAACAPPEPAVTASAPAAPATPEPQTIAAAPIVDAGVDLPPDEEQDQPAGGSYPLMIPDASGPQKGFGPAWGDSGPPPSGGGGRGEGIGLGNFEGLGHGTGTGTGRGFGRRSPSDAGDAGGRLPPEVIQRIVRQHMTDYRRCYENALQKNDKLEGRVVVRFQIDTRGTVSKAEDGGSTMPDAAVVTCVLAGFRKLVFPAPEGGPVTVVYPLAFAKGD
jgi:outer membrane biosynthesis protein TonB